MFKGNRAGKAINEKTFFHKEKKMKKARNLTLILLCVLTALACMFTGGCSSEKDGKDKLYVGMECNYQPYNYPRYSETDGAVKISNAAGYANGYDVMIAKKIAEEMNKELVIVKYEWNSLLSGVTTGALDLIIAGMSPTEERRQEIDFTDPYYVCNLVLVVRKDGKYAGASSLNDFNGAKITAQQGTFHDDVLKEQAAGYGIVYQTPMDTFSSMIVALNSNTIDAYVAENAGATADCKANSNLTYIPLVNGDTGFTCSPDQTELAVGLKKGSPYKEEINRILAGISVEDRQNMMNLAIDYLEAPEQQKNVFAQMGTIIATYYPIILEGVGYTLLVSLIGTIIGLLIGVLIGVYRTIPDPKGKALKVLKKIGDYILSAYVEIFRGTPMMVQAMVIFWGFALLNNGQTLNVVFSGLLIVSINTGAYMAEIVRGGIISVNKGQFEGAHAIGMTHFQTMNYVVLPQALRNILPSVANEFVINIKDTSVLNVIGFTELYFYAKSIVSINYQVFATYLLVAAIYFVLTFGITRILRLIEKKMDGDKNYKVALGSQNMDAESYVRENAKEN